MWQNLEVVSSTFQCSKQYHNALLYHLRNMFGHCFDARKASNHCKELHYVLVRFSKKRLLITLLKLR